MSKEFKRYILPTPREVNLGLALPSTEELQMSSSVLQPSAIETALLNGLFTMANGTISSLKEQANSSQKTGAIH